MRYVIAPNDEAQAWDVEVTDPITLRARRERVQLADILDWLRRLAVTDHLARLCVDTATVRDSPEPRFLQEAGQ